MTYDTLHRLCNRMRDSELDSEPASPSTITSLVIVTETVKCSHHVFFHV